MDQTATSRIESVGRKWKLRVAAASHLPLPGRIFLTHRTRADLDWSGCLFPVCEHFDFDVYYARQNVTERRPNPQLGQLDLAMNVHFSLSRIVLLHVRHFALHERYLQVLVDIDLLRAQIHFFLGLAQGCLDFLDRLA